MFCTVTHRLEINTCQEYEYGDATMTALSNSVKYPTKQTDMFSALHPIQS